MNNIIRPLTAIAAMQLFGLAPATAASVTLGSATPAVGDGVQLLAFSTSSADNTDHAFVGSDYLAADNSGLYVGQSFTTGSNVGGYELNSISVRQVSWAGTFWDYTGGEITLRIFPGGGGDNGELLLETVPIAPGAGSDAVFGGTPADPMWLTFALTSPLTVAANTQYSFAFRSNGTGANDQFFMELDGTSDGGAYTGGSSITVDDGNNLWNGNTEGDRAFVANMTAIPEPSITFLGGLGVLGLLRRRR